MANLVVNPDHIEWEVWLSTPDGYRHTTLASFSRFSLVKTANDVGHFSITMPNTLSPHLLKLDSLVEFWRKTGDGIPYLEFVGFLRSWKYEETGGGLETITLSGPDGNDLLNRRIVAYPAGDPGSSKSTDAVSMMNQIVIQNMGSTADQDRRYVNNGFKVVITLAAGANLGKSFAWRSILPVLREIADESTREGYPIYFQVEPYAYTDKRISFAFHTYQDRIGRDLSSSGGAQNPVVFSQDLDNLENPSLEFDFTEEANYIYSAGQNTAADRTVVEASDFLRWYVASIWNRREGFVDSRNYTDLEVAARAKSELELRRPRVRFSASLVDNGRFRYGRDWRFGDKITVAYKGFEFHDVIRAVRITVDEVGKETLEAKVEYAQ